MLYQKFLKNIFKTFQFNYLVIQIPSIRKIKTFLKSPHVNKKAKENFNLVIHKFKLRLSINYTVIKLLRYNVPKNIHLKIIYYNN